jgi:CRP/FNR family transcriptional regulator/CRP/FNR family cyclic AMP-dependent transcriptional regulator
MSSLNVDRVSLLRQVPLFASVQPDWLNELANRLTPRNYKRGETIFHKDDPGASLYIISSGQVKIATTSPEGEEVILAILTEGGFFGELSLLDGRTRSASATAMEATQTLTLHRADLLEAIGKRPEMASDLLAALSDRLRRTDLLLEDAIFLDLPARLAKRLLELGEEHGIRTEQGLEIELRLTQQDLANFVGASRVAVNKLLGVFQDKGLIKLDKHKLIILSGDDLRRQVG